MIILLVLIIYLYTGIVISFTCTSLDLENVNLHENIMLVFLWPLFLLNNFLNR